MRVKKQGLHRGLGERQIRLMALGAAIGVGLFLGSATRSKWLARHHVVVAIGGAVVFMIMRALGEMATHNPVAGSFSRYARDYLGPCRLPDRLELLVPMASYVHCRNHRRRHLHGHLVPRRAALDLGAWRARAMGTSTCWQSKPTANSNSGSP